MDPLIATIPKIMLAAHPTYERRRCRRTSRSFSSRGMLLKIGRLVYARTSLRFFKDVSFISFTPVRKMPSIKPRPTPMPVISHRFGAVGASGNDALSSTSRFSPALRLLTSSKVEATVCLRCLPNPLQNLKDGITL